jgi:hypothetical protein
LFVVPCAAVTAVTIAVVKPSPPENGIKTGLLLGGIGISKTAALVPKVGAATLNIFNQRVAALLFTK